MAKQKKMKDVAGEPQDGGLVTTEVIDAEEGELLPEGKLVCALTGELRTATSQEETLQSFIEQLHREYAIAIEDMGRAMHGFSAKLSIPEQEISAIERGRRLSLYMNQASRIG